MNPYRLIANFYDAYLDQSLYEDILQLIQSQINKGDALDLATGTGQMAFTLAKNNFHVDATDISLEMLQEAEKHLSGTKLPVKFYVHDIVQPIVSKKYDVITLVSDVVNHLCAIEEVSNVFKNISQALNKNGVFVFDAIHQEYIDQMIGYKDVLTLNYKELIWTVKKESDTSIKHLLKVDDEEASLIQYVYSDDEITEHLLRHQLVILKKVRTHERTIYLTKKAK